MGWSEDIKCNVGVKQRCPLFPILFGIHIYKLEECLGVAGCDGPKLVGMVINPLLYANNIILLAKIRDDLNKQFRILYD